MPSKSTEPDLRIAETAKQYIGDGVYASFDGYQIWLRTQQGNEIAVEPEVFRSLQEYARHLPGYERT